MHDLPSVQNTVIIPVYACVSVFSVRVQQEIRVAQARACLSETARERRRLASCITLHDKRDSTKNFADVALVCCCDCRCCCF